MKFYIRLRNEKGKEIGLAGNEYIDIDIMEGNKRIAALTVRDGKVYDENDNEIKKHK